MLLRRSGSGFLTYGSSYSLHLPSRMTSGLSQVSSPFTVAGQRRTCTGFPVLQGVKMNTDTSIWATLGRLQNLTGIATISSDGLRAPPRRTCHTPPTSRHYNSVMPVCNTVFSTCVHLTYSPSASSKALPSCRSAVAKPSVNWRYIGARRAAASLGLSCCCHNRPRLTAARNSHAFAC